MDTERAQALITAAGFWIQDIESDGLVISPYTGENRIAQALNDLRTAYDLLREED